MANHNCYARFYLPLTSEDKPDINATGHVDLQVDGLNDAPLNYDDHAKNIESPVFSYGGISGQGYVKILPDANTTSVITNRHLLCEYEFTATSSQGSSFINAMRSSITYDSTYDAYYLYKVNSNHPFSTYSVNRYNCYGATAQWCNILGFTGLLQTYNQYTNDGDGYKNYICWKTFEKKFRYFIYQHLHKH